LTRPRGRTIGLSERKIRERGLNPKILYDCAVNASVNDKAEDTGRVNFTLREDQIRRKCPEFARETRIDSVRVRVR
jgi:hypothetical protein